MKIAWKYKVRETLARAVSGLVCVSVTMGIMSILAHGINDYKKHIPLPSMFMLSQLKKA